MSITRVQYRERQRLTAADLRFEQDYRLGLGGRHHFSHHRWGIVRGLRIVETRGDFVLTPGVAIDGYGREILVPRAIEIEFEGFDKEGCWFVVLHYCEDPEQVPPGRPCKDEPAPRIRQRTAVVVSDRLDLPAESSDDVARARAAGRMTGLPPWPVLVATYGLGCRAPGAEAASLIDYSRTLYVDHRASIIRSPTAGALVQLGLSGRTDVYHFLVSTSGSTLSKRIGIDRDGALHVWRPLVISGTQAYGEVEIGHNLKLQISSPLPAGIGSRVRIEGRFDANLRTLSASLLDLGAAAPGGRLVLQTEVAVKGKSATLVFGAGRMASFHPYDLAKRQPISFAAARRRLRPARRRVATLPMEAVADAPVTAPAPAKSFSVELEPFGGKLLLKKPKRISEIQEIPCGDIDRTRDAVSEAEAPVLQFKPATDLEPDPRAREIHAVTTSKATDAVPKTELRISGGAADDSDTSSRVSFGAQISGQYGPALRMDGGRRVEILAAPAAPKGEPLLAVTDTVYLPPIGKKDPLLPDLLTLALIGGLRRIGNVTSAVTLTLSPKTGSAVSVKRGETLAYKMKILWTANFSIKRTLELITAAGGAGDMSFRAIEISIASGSGSSQTFDIEVPRFTRVETGVQVVVLMLVELGNHARVVVSPPLPVSVTDA
jgi:hypothetical protein